VRACVCVCVSEREREKERVGERETEYVCLVLWNSATARHICDVAYS